MGQAAVALSKVKIVEREYFARYMKAIDEFESEIQTNPYEHHLYQMIGQLIKRKVDGDLKDNEDVPAKEEIEIFLGVGNNQSSANTIRYRAYKEMMESYAKNIETHGTALVQQLRDNDFINQFSTLKDASVRKSKYYTYLSKSSIGMAYLNECLHFVPMQSTADAPPLFSYEAFLNDIVYLEQTNHFDHFAEAFRSLLSILTELVEKIPPKTYLVVEQKIYYLFYSLITKFTQEVVFNGLVYRTYTEIQAFEFLLALRKIKIKEIKFKSQFIKYAPHATILLQFFILGCQMRIATDEIKENPSAQSYLELSNVALNTIEATQVLLKTVSPDTLNLLNKSGAKALGSIFGAANVANSFIVGPALTFYNFNDFSNAIYIGDDRASWEAGMSAVSNISTLVMVAVGVPLSSPLIVIVPITCAVAILIGGYTLDSSFENKMKTWLNSNYFGTNTNNSYAIKERDPKNIGFEWDKNIPFKLMLILQIRALFSLLHPLNSECDELKQASNATYHLTLRLKNPAIPPGDFYVRLRFFNAAGEEVTNPDVNGASTRPGYQLMYVPVTYYQNDFLPVGWKKSPESDWFVKQTLVPLDGFSSGQIGGNNVGTYELTIVFNKARELFYKYYQIQIIATGSRIDTQTLLSQSQLIDVLMTNPFIYTETKPMK